MRSSSFSGEDQKVSSMLDNRSWFESWRGPSEFFRAAHCKILSIPLGRSVPNYLSEAYVAGLFARIWNDHSECRVRLVPRPDQFPDSQLDEAGKIRDFEIVIADRKDRRIFAEYAEWARMSRRKELLPVQISGGAEKQQRRMQAREAISRVCETKVIHYIGSTTSNKLVAASLLIYLNIGQLLSNLGTVLSVDEMAELTEPYGNKFQSIWVLCGIEAVRTWPKRKVLRATCDPFAEARSP
jgi:hypothetical protein